jgi:hypothetical protein
MKQRDDDFGTRSSVACDVSGELMDVGDNDRFTALSGSTADSPAQSDSHAGHLALKWAQHQLAATKKVEADPIYSRQRLKEQCCEIGGIGETIGFAGKQRGELMAQLRPSVGVITCISESPHVVSYNRTRHNHLNSPKVTFSGASPGSRI